MIPASVLATHSEISAQVNIGSFLQKMFGGKKQKSLQTTTWVFPKIGVPPNHPS